nr:N-acetylmuramoyl-L-alanine amidase [Paenibacillus sacheonensis]
MPTQILLHETATSGSMNISGVRMEKNYYPVPHFCVNNIDNSGNGQILQFVDIAEKTYHGELLNDRSVGIEFVNEPLQEKDHPDLAKSKAGVYLKTVLDKYSKLHIPLEFDESKADQTLTVNKSDLINWSALKTIEVGAAKTKAATEKDGVVTLKFVKSDKFEHLASLMRLLQDKGGFPGLDIDAAEQHRSVVTVDKKQVFVFQHGYDGKEKEKLYHYAIDIRQRGIYTHGLIGGHHDGYLQGLYMYLKLIKKQQPLACLQSMLDMIAKSKLPKDAKRPPLKLKELLTVTKGKEEVPKSPKEITITSYLELP